MPPRPYVHEVSLDPADCAETILQKAANVVPSHPLDSLKSPLEQGCHPRCARILLDNQASKARFVRVSFTTGAAGKP